MNNGSLKDYTNSDYLQDEVSKKKVNGTDEIQDYVSDLNLWQRLNRTLRGKTEFGRISGAVLDVVQVFAPRYAGEIRMFLKSQLNGKSMTKDKPKLLSKTVWSAIIIALTAILQGLGVDLTADPELTVHIYETIYGLGGALGLYGLRDAVRQLIEKSN